MQKLPIGTQSFSILRKNNYLYVDKTKYICKLIEDGRLYFLSRPRRFGKSLLVSTLEEVFKGNKKLFEGLYIQDNWPLDKKYPVLVLDFGGDKYKTVDDLKVKITDIINRKAREFGVEIYSESLGEKFTDLITGIYNKTKKEVVILIDEYDKPILANLGNNNLKEFQDEIGSFYEVLKTNDEYIKFLFLTGISKLAHVSIFSKLNSPKDITLNEKYNSICGYTQVELETNFQYYIEKLAIKFNCVYGECVDYIKYYYNGYSWNGKEKVYNPFSTLLCFDDGEFSKNWFNTGTPSVLADYPMSKYSQNLSYE